MARHARTTLKAPIAQAVSDAVKAERKKARKPAAGALGKPKGKGRKRG